MIDQSNVTESPKTELQTALQNLDRLASELKGNHTPNFLELDLVGGSVHTQKKSLLRKGMELTSQLIASTFSQKNLLIQEKQLLQRQSQILQWVDTVKAHFEELSQWKEGGPRQRQKAADALSTIRRYNELLKRAKKEPKSWLKKLGNLVYEQAGYGFDSVLKDSIIKVPRKAHHRRRFTCQTFDQSQKLFLQNVLSPRKQMVQATRCELDSFRMKASILLRTHTDLAASRETFAVIKEAPVFSVLQGEGRPGGQARAAIVSLSQTLSTFPGETMQIKGSFERSGDLTIPLPATFQLLTESQQTGFPHPLQYCGWALGDTLIPDCPLRPRDLPRAWSLIERKQQLARALLPEGPWLPMAKRWLEMRKEVYQEREALLLSLHKSLFTTLLGAHPCIESYFEQSALQEKPLIALGRTWQGFHERYCMRLFELLKDHYFSHRAHEPLLLTELCEKLHKRQRKKIAKSGSVWPRAESELILLMGNYLAPPCAEIMLQTLSEKIGIAPPILSPLAMRLQASAWRQLESFISDLEGSVTSGQLADKTHIAREIAHLLQRDIKLFELPLEQLELAQGMDYVRELRRYYDKRFSTHGRKHRVLEPELQSIQ